MVQQYNFKLWTVICPGVQTHGRRIGRPYNATNGEMSGQRIFRDSKYYCMWESNHTALLKWKLYDINTQWAILTNCLKRSEQICKAQHNINIVISLSWYYIVMLP